MRIDLIKKSITGASNNNRTQHVDFPLINRDLPWFALRKVALRIKPPLFAWSKQRHLPKLEHRGPERISLPQRAPGDPALRCVHGAVLLLPFENIFTTSCNRTVIVISVACWTCTRHSFAQRTLEARWFWPDDPSHTLFHTLTYST